MRRVGAGVERWPARDVCDRLEEPRNVTGPAARQSKPAGRHGVAMKANRIVQVIVVLLSAFSLVSAGEVYGRIVEGASPVGESATLEVRCGSKAYPAVKTDKSGSYRVVLAETGKCSMTVKYKQQSASLDIASYDDPVQIDLVVGMKDGKLAVRRK